MGLDVYVGTLTRYFTGDWETIVQQMGRQQGIAVEIHRAPPQDDEVIDPEEMRNGILAWKRGFTDSVRDELGLNIDWSESSDEPYFTNKPGFEGHAGVCLLAAYSLYPSVPRPSSIPDAWADDPVWLAYFGQERQTLRTMFKRKLGPPSEGRLFAHVTDLQMWLPGDFTTALTIKGLADGALVVGSTAELLRQLNVLNDRTYRADRKTMEAWLGEELDETFDQEARRGLAMFTDLATKAVEHHLPMKLDY